MQTVVNCEEPFDSSSNYDTIMLLRRIELSIGCLMFIVLIIHIIHRKLFVYNTLRLFLFMCICYLIGMGVVLFHTSAFTANFKRSNFIKDNDEVDDDPNGVWSCMKNNNSINFCGVQAFINLFFYCFGYLFAVLITYNVHCVINNTYRHFMKNVLKMKKIIILFFIMFGFHFAPLLTIWIWPSQEVPYFAYGGTGFKYDNQDLLLFCGPFFRQDINLSWLWQIILFSLIYSVPLVFLVIHSILAFHVQMRIRQFELNDYLNSKENFIIKSGKIGIIIFIIQLINFLKLLLKPFLNEKVTLIINFIFDAYPVLILVFYFKYVKEKKGIVEGSSTLVTEP